MKAEVQINYRIPNQDDWGFASIRLSNLSIDSIEFMIEKRLRQMYPNEKKQIEYKIIGIS
jgi:hypothetical protein